MRVLVLMRENCSSTVDEFTGVNRVIVDFSTVVLPFHAGVLDFSGWLGFRFHTGV